MKVDEEDNMKRIIRWKNYNSVPGDFVIATSMQHWISDLEEAKTNYLIPYGEGEFDNNNWMAFDFDRQTQYEKETKAPITNYAAHILVLRVDLPHLVRRE